MATACASSPAAIFLHPFNTFSSKPVFTVDSSGNFYVTGFTFSLKYDQNPAPRPLPKNTPAGYAFANTDSNFYSDKVDTLTEASLIYTFM